MLRTTVLALAATAMLGVTTLASTPASASHRGYSWQHRHHHPHFSVRISAPRAYAYYPRCYVKRHWVHTRWGWRLRSVRVCR